MLQKVKSKRLKHKLPKQLVPITLVNTLLILFQFIYTKLRFIYLNDEIPFWYTKPWGNAQLASKTNIWAIPVTALLLVIVGVFFSIYSINKFMRFGDKVILGLITIYNFILTYSLLKIIRIASLPFEPLVDPLVLDLLKPLVLGFLAVYMLMPKFIQIANDKGMVTTPKKDKHPGMALQEPSARGGGVVFAIAFILLTILLVPLTSQVIGILLGVLVLAGVSLADDIQNTNPYSKLKFLESPILRLGVQALAVGVVIFSGIKATFINNPFDGILFLDKFTINIGNATIAPIALIFTFVWILWIINMLSFSNGIDGQYSGIISVAGIVIAILALRNLGLEPSQIYVSKMAGIMAGASLGILPFNWQPSKVMWSFGATTAGLIIASLSLMTQAKVSISILALMIPFIDAAVTVTRRVIQGKSPLKADRGHLHHLLLEKGWSVKSVAIFYWVSAITLGAVAIFSSDKSLSLIILTLAGLIIFPIILLNIANLKAKS